VDYEWVHPLAIEFQKRTGSRQAQKILANWASVRRGRKLIKVLPLAVARSREDYKTVGTNAG
jgi:glutamate synthase domain-containing protein 3